MSQPKEILIIKCGASETNIFSLPELYDFTGVESLVQHLGGVGARWSSARALKNALEAKERFFDFRDTEGSFCHSNDDIVELLGLKKPILISFDPRETKEGEKTASIEVIIFPMEER